MARSQGSFGKRQKELARREKQLKKQARRQEARDRRTEGAAAGGAEDPDLAGIQLGPQPDHPLPPTDEDGSEEVKDDVNDPE